jgi:hypothetical protein
MLTYFQIKKLIINSKHKVYWMYFLNIKIKAFKIDPS